MKKKLSRLSTIKMIVSSQEIGSQEDLLKALKKEGFVVTQATLSRDLKQLKVAKAANSDGRYIYVLPNDIMYRRFADLPPGEMLAANGFQSLDFSGNLAVIHTRPGYASSMAYDIDNHPNGSILGTIAGDDTIIMVLREGADRKELYKYLSGVVPGLK